jgi:hypothetical protein
MARTNTNSGGSGGGNLSGNLTTSRIPYASGANTLVDDANFTRTASTFNVSSLVSGGHTSMFAQSANILGVGIPGIQLTATNGDGYFNGVVAGDGTGVIGPDHVAILGILNTSGGSIVSSHFSTFYDTGSGNVSADIQVQDLSGNQLSQTITPNSWGLNTGGGPNILSVNRTGNVTFNSAFTFPNTDGTVGQVLKTNGAGVVSWSTGGGGSPGGSNTSVQFNDAGVFGGGNDFTWDKTGKQFRVGDLTNTANHTSLSVKDSNSQVVVNGNQVSTPAGGTVGTITYTGFGVNDLSVDATAFNLLGVTAYNIEVDATSMTYVTFTPATGVVSVGDTITDGTTGATGTVVSRIGTSWFAMASISGGTFNMGDPISGGAGFTGTVGSSSIQDGFKIDEGGFTQATFWPLAVQPFQTMGHVGLGIGINIGHIINGTADFSITPNARIVTYGQMLSLDGQSNIFSFGDVNNINNGGLLDMASGKLSLGYNNTGIIVNNGADAIQFKFAGGNYVFPNTDGTANQIMKTDGAGNISWENVPAAVPALTQNQIAFGDASNLMTSNGLMTYDPVGGAYLGAFNFFQIANPANITQRYIDAAWSSGNPFIHLGDLTAAGNNTVFTLDDFTHEVDILTPGGRTIIGDNNQLVNKTVFSVDDQFQKFEFKGLGGVYTDRIALYDNLNRIIKLGDVDNDFNNTTLNVDDINRTVALNAVHVRLGLQTYATNAAAITAGLVSGDAYSNSTLGAVVQLP